MCMTLTLKQCDFAFVGKKAYLSQQVKKKNPSKGSKALALVSLVRFFLVRFWFYQLASQMCSLDFNHYCLLWRYENINVGDDIKCKSIELFLYSLNIVVVCKYICGASSEQKLLTRQNDKETCMDK